LNAVGLQNVGVRAFVAEKLPVLRKFDTAVIANVFGYTLEDYVEVIRVLEDSEGLAGYELNISCPNVKRGGMQFGSDPGMVFEVVGPPDKPPPNGLFGSNFLLLLQTLDLLPGPPRRQEPTP
jgi:dihydroorotate dehydrogenase